MSRAPVPRRSILASMPKRSLVMFASMPSFPEGHEPVAIDDQAISNMMVNRAATLTHITEIAKQIGIPQGWASEADTARLGAAVVAELQASLEYLRAQKKTLQIVVQLGQAQREYDERHPPFAVDEQAAARSTYPFDI